MPYAKNSDLPDGIRNALPEKAQSIFRNVFNSQAADGKTEEQSFASAWQALKNQGWEKGENGKWYKVTKMAGLSFNGKITKSEPKERLVFGWASIVEDENGHVVDSQGEIIKIEELEKAAYEFVLSVRKSGEMHETVVADSNLVESIVLTKEKQKAMGLENAPLPVGWWVGFKLPDDAFQKVLSGEYTMFSIGGSGGAREYAG